MEYAMIKTLTGMTIENLREALDQNFEPAAYKNIPGGADLTDIDPAYMKKCLNDVFGICGLGWGYEYNPADMVIEAGSKADWTGAFLKAGIFWFKLVDDSGQEHKVTIQASGGSENKRVEFALKGALTNMISNAVSQIGFQESVYMGRRSHRTENGDSRQRPGKPAAKAAAPAEKPAQPAKAEKEAAQPSTPAGKPAAPAKPAAQAQTAKPAEASAKPTPAKAHTPYIVPAGSGIAAKHQGQVLSEMSDAAVQFYAAGGFTPTDDASKEFRQKCLEEVKARASSA